MNITELEEFIEELNEQLRFKKGKFHSLTSHLMIKAIDQEYHVARELTETELKVYIKLSNYFRLTTITIPDLAIAYEMWLKGILPLLLEEVGLSSENWDEICSLGDHDSKNIERVDKEWLDFLEQIKKGQLNHDVWKLIQLGKKRSGIIRKRHLIRKKRSM